MLTYIGVLTEPVEAQAQGAVEEAGAADAGVVILHVCVEVLGQPHHHVVSIRSIIWL